MLSFSRFYILHASYNKTTLTCVCVSVRRRPPNHSGILNTSFETIRSSSDAICQCRRRPGALQLTPNLFDTFMVLQVSLILRLSSHIDKKKIPESKKRTWHFELKTTKFLRTWDLNKMKPIRGHVRSLKDPKRRDCRPRAPRWFFFDLRENRWPNSLRFGVTWYLKE